MSITGDSIFTTGQIAKLQGVAPRTVTKWCDHQGLRCYRIPGGNDRRIRRADLIDFLKAKGLPLDGLASGILRVLLLSNDAPLVERLQSALSPLVGCSVHVTGNFFTAGGVVEQYRPNLFVVDLAMGRNTCLAVVASLRGQAQYEKATMLAVACEDDGEKPDEFDSVFRRPFDVAELVACVAETIKQW